MPARRGSGHPHQEVAVLRRTSAPLIAAALLLVGVLSPVGAVTSDGRVSAGSPVAPFSQNKQNEPGLAIDPSNPMIVAAGANDNIDMEACNAGDPKTCPFTHGVGVSGIYFSTNGGASWMQPTYTGYSARNCLGPAVCTPNPSGLIGTLPNYVENGMISNGDPILAFGPRMGSDGRFAWSNGSRLYYSNIATKFSAPSSSESFKGPSAIAVSRTDNIAGAMAGVNGAWMAPVIATKQNAAVFEDKEYLWVDNAASSSSFGNVYVCNVAFRSNGGAPEPVVFARSTDGGDTWSQSQLSQAANTVSAGKAGGRQGCTIRTDSTGVVYVFWAGSLNRQSVQYLARSWNGGVSFERPRAVATVTEVGALDPVQGRNTMDGVAGARSGSSFPTVDIANGAPTGAGPTGAAATNRIVLAWPDGAAGLDHEKLLFQTSTNGGTSWSVPMTASAAGDRPDYAAVAISPNGNDVYVVYDNHMRPWQATTLSPRLMQGVVRHADWTDLTAWSDVHRGASGDNRGSSANALFFEFLGDYNSAMATNSGVVGVWTDVRNAVDCTPIDLYRQDVANGGAISGAGSLRPAPQNDCVPGFGNTDIYGGAFVDPTP